MDLLLKVAAYTCFGTCLLGLNFIYLLLQGLFRNLPTLVSFMRRAAREFLLLSYRLYRPILIHGQPHVWRYLGVNLGNVYIRTTATTLLSLVFLALIYLVMGWQFSVFGTGLAILHGLAVGLVWNEIGHPDGLEIGEELP